MPFKLEFKTTNAVFKEYECSDVHEIQRILKDVLLLVEDGNEHGPVRDINGNIIGEWAYEQELTEPCPNCGGTGAVNALMNELCHVCRATGRIRREAAT